MTKRTSRIVGYCIWAALVVPLTVLYLWLGFGEWSWRGFFTGFALLACIAITFDVLERWIEGMLRRRREARNTAPSPSES